MPPSDANANPWVLPLGILLGLSLLSTASAHLDSPDHGTLSFHDAPEDGATTRVSCEFWIQGHGMSHDGGMLRAAHNLGGPGAEGVTLGEWTGTPDASGGFSFLAGPFTLPESDEWQVWTDMGDGGDHATEFHTLVYEACEPAPACPANVVAHAQPDGSILLTWDPVADAEAYHVYKSADGAAMSHVLATGETRYHDTGTEAGATYLYRVTAENAHGESPGCPLVEATAVPFFGAPLLGALALAGGVGALAWMRGAARKP